MAGSESQITPQIDNLYLFDRTVDPLTPLMTQLTYEGLIDEIYDIQNSKGPFPLSDCESERENFLECFASLDVNSSL